MEDPRIGWFQPEQRGPALEQWDNYLNLVVLRPSGDASSSQLPQSQTDSGTDDFDKAEDAPPKRPGSWKGGRKLGAETSLLKSIVADQDDTPLAYYTDAAGVLARRQERNRACTYGFNKNQARLIKDWGGMPWLQSGKAYTPGLQGLHEEIKDFCAWMSPKPHEELLRLQVFERLRKLIHEFLHVPPHQIGFFGSFATGVFLPTSDIDVVVSGHWDDMYLMMHQLAFQIKMQRLARDDSVKILDRASVPIIKIVDLDTDIRVDISFNMVNAYRSVEAIKELMCDLPPLRYLVFVLKQFLLQRDLNEVFTGGVSSYSLILMTVSFLQMHDACELVHTEPTPNGPCNLGMLLLQFLELYGRGFNYLNTAIKVTDGGQYAAKHDLMPNMSTGHRTSMLCIQDPHDPTNDIGRSSHGVMKVAAAFDYAFQVLSVAIDSDSPDVYRERDSLLGRIVRVTDAVMNYRQFLETVCVDRGLLCAPASADQPQTHAHNAYEQQAMYETANNACDMITHGQSMQHALAHTHRRQPTQVEIDLGLADEEHEHMLVMNQQQQRIHHTHQSQHGRVHDQQQQTVGSEPTVSPASTPPTPITSSNESSPPLYGTDALLDSDQGGIHVQLGDALTQTRTTDDTLNIRIPVSDALSPSKVQSPIKESSLHEHDLTGASDDTGTTVVESTQTNTTVVDNTVTGQYNQSLVSCTYAMQSLLGDDSDTPRSRRNSLCSSGAATTNGSCEHDHDLSLEEQYDEELATSHVAQPGSSSVSGNEPLCYSTSEYQNDVPTTAIMFTNSKLDRDPFRPHNINSRYQHNSRKHNRGHGHQHNSHLHNYGHRPQHPGGTGTESGSGGTSVGEDNYAPSHRSQGAGASNAASSRVYQSASTHYARTFKNKTYAATNSVQSTQGYSHNHYNSTGNLSQHSQHSNSNNRTLSAAGASQHQHQSVAPVPNTVSVPHSHNSNNVPNQSTKGDGYGRGQAAQRGGGGGGVRGRKYKTKRGPSHRQN